MNKLVESMMTKDTFTANGAITNSTSLNKCLDFFSVCGTHKDFSAAFFAAFAEDPNLAMRILFWSRDCRGGAGARKTFGLVMGDIQKRKPHLFSKVFKFIPEYGYWKDIFNLAPSQDVVDFVSGTLLADEDHSLCAKYCPRKGVWVAKLRAKLHMTVGDFRRFIVSKTKVVEQLMCAKRWESIDYSKVPSIAGLRYSETFRAHDKERYEGYLQDVLKGNAKVNSSVLYPHDIYEKFIDTHDKLATDALWKGLPDFMAESEERILPVCDVSGSMMGRPMSVSVGLGCYLSEKNKGCFKDAFITFSARPRMNYLEGSISDRFIQLTNADWGGNTDLAAVFDLILFTAVKNHLSESDMPTKILIISDMQFDIAASNRCTNFEYIKNSYESIGYRMPGIIFWNVNGSAGNVPATMRDLNVGLVSGYSPSIMESIFKCEVLTPMELMLTTVNSERYQQIRV